MAKSAQTRILSYRSLRFRLVLAAALQILSYLVPGIVLLLYSLDRAWFLWAPAGDPYGWRVEFDPFWPYELAIALLAVAGILTVLYVFVWASRSELKRPLVKAYSLFNLVLGGVYLAVAILFAYVIPTGYSSAGPSFSPLLSSGPPGLFILATGAYGLALVLKLDRDESLAPQCDRTSGPSKLTRKGAALVILGVVCVSALILGVLLNPFISPLPYVRDSDMDGKSEAVDYFPDDSGLWEPARFRLNASETAGSHTIQVVEVYSDNLLPVPDFYVSISSPDGEMLMKRTPLYWWDSEYIEGVLYLDLGTEYLLDIGDQFVIDKATYATSIDFRLTDSDGERTYVDLRLG